MAGGLLRAGFTKHTPLIKDEKSCANLKCYFFSLTKYLSKTKSNGAA